MTSTEVVALHHPCTCTCQQHLSYPLWCTPLRGSERTQPGQEVRTSKRLHDEHRAAFTETLGT